MVMELVAVQQGMDTQGRVLRHSPSMMYIVGSVDTLQKWKLPYERPWLHSRELPLTTWIREYDCNKSAV